MQCTKTLSSTRNKKSVKKRLINASSQSRTSDLFLKSYLQIRRTSQVNEEIRPGAALLYPGPYLSQLGTVTAMRTVQRWGANVDFWKREIKSISLCSVTSVSLKWFQLYIYSLELLACRRLADRKKYTQCKDPVCLLSSIYHWWWGVQFASIAKKESAYTILDFEGNRLFCDTDDLNLKEKCPMIFANATH